MANLFGGYDSNFSTEVHKRFICNVCLKVLRDPHLMFCCGEKFCASCLEKWFDKNHSKTCPVCRAEKGHILEKGMKREIESFEVHCSKQDMGCNWKGELRNLNKHIQSDSGCGYCAVECPNKCETDDRNIALILRKDLDEHISKKCQLRLVTCTFCGHVGTMKKYDKHTKICEYFPVDCPNDCGYSGLIRRLIDYHRQECRLELVECKNKGCNVKLARQDMLLHETEKCDLRIVPCGFCKQNYVYKQYDDHLAVCDMFPIRCPNQCGDSTIVRGTLSMHKEVCKFEIVECRLGCQEQMQRCDRDKHEKRTCLFREMQCQYCKEVCMYVKLMEHNDVCEMYPLTCPNECGEKGIVRKTLESHKQVCALEVIECKYAYVGCKKKAKRKFMPQHEKDVQKRHLDLMAEAHLQASIRLKETENAMLNHEKVQELKAAQQKLADNEVKLKETSLELEKVTSKLEDMILKADSLQEQLDEERRKNFALRMKQDKRIF